ncbi:MAG: PKD domain-containing protein [Chitinophagales bacterium]
MKKNILKYSLFSLLFLCVSIGAKAEGDMSFIENKGQWMEQIQYKSPLNFGDIYFEKDNFTFILQDYSTINHNHEDFEHDHFHEEESINGHHYKMQFVGANEDVTFSEENKSQGYYNYFLGNDESKWASNVFLYKAITYHNIYDGIDMKVMGNGGDMKYEYYVEPYADVSQVKVRYLGLDAISIKNGALHYETSVASVSEMRPYVYQIIEGKRVVVKAEYILDDSSLEVSYNFPNGYDEAYELVIDPSIIFASYSGSTLNNFGYTATYDNDGNLYGGGIYFGDNAGLTGYPVLNAFQSTTTGGVTGSYSNGFPSDIAITKYSTDGSTLIYSTLIGGAHNEQPQSLFVNENGELVIYGRSYSTDFPTTAGAYQEDRNPVGTNSDIIVLKLGADGDTLVGSTYIGGDSNDGVNISANPSGYGATIKHNYADDGRGEVLVDDNGYIYIASCTQSTNLLPDSITSIKDTLGGYQDACLLKFNEGLTELMWGTYLGGAEHDASYGIKIDSLGYLFATGGTNSEDFPATLGGLNDTAFGGRADGFITKIDIDNDTILQSTYLGTPQYDQCFFIEIDDDNDIYVFGQTRGAYPVSAGVYSVPNSAQFIHKLNDDLTTTEFSTVFGNGTNANVNISPTAFLVDKCGKIYTSGWGGITNASNAGGDTQNMPITADALQSNTDGSDFHIMLLAKDATNLLYGSYYGGDQSSGGSGEHVDGGTSRFDRNGIVYQAVCASCGTAVSNFPTTAGAWAEQLNQNICNLGVIKLEVGVPSTDVDVEAFPTATGCAPLTVIFDSELINVTEFSWDFDDGNTSNLSTPIHTFVDTGYYRVRLIGIDSTSCNVADTAYLDVYVDDDTLVANFQNSVQIDCSTRNVVLQSPSNYPTTTFYWDMGDGNTYNTPSVNHTYASAGDYTIFLRVSDSTSCELADSMEYDVSIPPLLVNEFTVSDTFGCIPLVVDFENLYTVFDEVYWSFGENGQSDIQSQTSYTYENVGNYQVELIVVDSSTCNQADTSYINITTGDEIVTADFDATILSDCDSLLSIELDNQSLDATIYTWDFDDGNFSNVEEPGIYDYTTIGGYTIMLIAENPALCNVVDTVSQSFVLKPNGVIDFNIEPVCEGNVIVLENYGDENANYIWRWINNTSEVYEPEISFNHSGDYVISLEMHDTSTCNLIAIHQDTVSVLERPIALFTTDTSYYLYPDDTYFYNQSQHFDGFQWSFGDGSIDTVEESPIHFYEQLYEMRPCLSVCNEACEDTFCKDIYIDFIPLIGVPNAFSPNDDGVNDVIFVEGVGVTALSFKVFNRWGELIFETNDQSIGWDGTYFGVPQEMEVYTYVVNAVFYDESSTVLKGNISLIR